MKGIQFISDFGRSRFGDSRNFDRLQVIAQDLALDPSLSFPKAMPPANLLGYYRFVGNTSIKFEDVLAGHTEETRLRCLNEAEVLVLHDTSKMECTSVSFQAHVSLAVSYDCTPLGVLNVLLNPRGSQEPKSPESPNELERWRDAIASTSDQVPNAIHVYDREPDDFGFFHWQLSNSIRFVARSRWDRKLTDGNRMTDVLSGLKVRATRSVAISGRLRGQKSSRDLKIHPERDNRLAVLSIYATRLAIINPKSPKEFAEVNVVWVKENNPPNGESPIEWRLLTNEPVDSAKQILRIVDIYRKRWVIEEFFKALKTGCQFEKRQHESYDVMVIALAILIPMAMQLLLLRSLSRVKENIASSAVLTETQIVILTRLPRTAKLPNQTVKEALLAVAALGGHLKSNGPPGWLTLGRGLETLQKYEVGWLLAKHGLEM